MIVPRGSVAGWRKRKHGGTSGRCWQSHTSGSSEAARAAPPSPASTCRGARRRGSGRRRAMSRSSVSSRVTTRLPRGRRAGAPGGGSNFVGMSGSMRRLSPRCAPPSIQLETSSTCSWVRPRSLRNSPKPFTAPHGGMRRDSTASLMATRARLRVLPRHERKRAAALAVARGAAIEKEARDLAVPGDGRIEVVRLDGADGQRYQHERTQVGLKACSYGCDAAACSEDRNPDHDAGGATTGTSKCAVFTTPLRWNCTQMR